MLDIGFWELVVVSLVFLLVLGPERLPTALAKIGKIIGKIKRIGKDLEHKISTEITLDELKDEHFLARKDNNTILSKTSLPSSEKNTTPE